MTLRARLATAFVAVLLGPAVSGAYLAFEYWPRPAPTGDPDGLVQRLVAECQHLTAIARGNAAAGITRTGDGGPLPDGPWLICGPDATRPVLPPVLELAGTRYGGLAARVELRSGGEVTGYAYAARPLDADFLSQLSVAAGGTVTMLDAGVPGTVAGLPFQIVPPSTRDSRDGGNTGVWLIAVVASAVLVAAGLGWWLAGLATRPLTVLRKAVEQVAAGDLTARSLLSGRDETGRLGTALDRVFARLQETLLQSLTDPLTGLGNVRQLGDALRRESERATRFGRTLGVLVLDLDHFKTINDRYGHRAGDAVLVEFAHRVRRVVREVDLTFRQGGEEFVILLPETDVAGSLTAARRIGEAVRDTPFTLPESRPDSLSHNEIAVTVSVGVAVFPRHARTASDIIDAADAALYAAKHAGRDTFALADVAYVSTTAHAVALVGQGRATPVRLAEAGGAPVGTTSPRTSPAG
jgi:diguanylate cyclase (GGDEF)-like protein